MSTVWLVTACSMVVKPVTKMIWNSEVPITTLVGMPTKVVIGTSLFQIIFVTAFTTMLHAVTNQTVDIALALLLIAGGVIGAQLGTRIGARMKAEQLRILLALLVLAVCGQLALGLVLEPSELYEIQPVTAQ